MPETLSACHVQIMETAVIPEQHEVQVQLSKEGGGSIEDFTGIMEPELKFSQRHSLLFARSISTSKNGCTIARLLNPTTTPITVHQSEKVGSFHPVEITAVHTLDAPGSRPPMSESIPAEVDAAIAKMMSGVEDLMGEETDQLRALLASYSDIISTSDTDIGRTDKLKHVINTEGPPNQAGTTPIAIQSSSRGQGNGGQDVATTDYRACLCSATLRPGSSNVADLSSLNMRIYNNSTMLLYNGL